MSTPRGLANCNPGNIRKTRDKWQGLTDQQTDPQFFRFKSPVWGIRAMAILLISYQDRHGLRTIKDIIGKYAPASENNTKAYIKDVVGRSGFAATMPLDLHRYADLRPVIEAMIWHENGIQPYDDAVIDEGLHRAGVIDTPAPITRTTAGRGGQIAATSTAANVGLETAWQAIEPARDAIAQAAVYVDALKWLLLALTLLGVGMMLWPLIKGRRVQAA